MSGPAGGGLGGLLPLMPRPRWLGVLLGVLHCASLILILTKGLCSWGGAAPIVLVGLLWPLFTRGLWPDMRREEAPEDPALAELSSGRRLLYDTLLRLLLGGGVILSALPYLLLGGAAVFIGLSMVILPALVSLSIHGSLAASEARLRGRLAWWLCGLVALLGALPLLRYTDVLPDQHVELLLRRVSMAALLLSYAYGRVAQRPLLSPPRVFGLFALLLVWRSGQVLVRTAAHDILLFSAQLILFERPGAQLPGLRGWLAHPLSAVLWALSSIVALELGMGWRPSWDLSEPLARFAAPAAVGLGLGAVGVAPVAGTKLAELGYALIPSRAQIGSGLAWGIGGLGLMILVVARLRAAGGWSGLAALPAGGSAAAGRMMRGDDD